MAQLTVTAAPASDKIRILFMRTGYVESSSIAVTHATYSGDGFDTKEEALRNLALHFYWDMKVNYKPFVSLKSKCCQAALKKNAASCSKCGTKLRTEFVPEDFTDTVRGLLGTDSNGCDAGFGDYSNWPKDKYYWWAWNSIAELFSYWKDHPGSVVEIHENAEYEILKHLDPKEMDEQDQGPMQDYLASLKFDKESTS